MDTMQRMRGSSEAAFNSTAAPKPCPTAATGGKPPVFSPTVSSRAVTSAYSFNPYVQYGRALSLPRGFQTRQEYPAPVRPSARGREPCTPLSQEVQITTSSGFSSRCGMLPRSFRASLTRFWRGVSAPDRRGRTR